MKGMCNKNTKMVTNVVFRLTLVCCLSGRLLALPTTKSKCESQLATCLLREEDKRIICEKNNQTFLSRCQLFKLQCEGFPVTLHQKDSCSGKSDTKRRSFNRQRNKRGCSRTDRTEFRTNLLNIFRAEHARSKGLSAEDITILDWKFSGIDSNANGFLDESEYRQLRRLLKKVVQPRRCARNFGRICDSDHDTSISQKEWVACLSREGNNSTSGDDRSEQRRHNKTEGLRRPHRHGQIQKTKPALLLQGSLTRVSAHFSELDDPIDRTKDETDSNDCLSDKKAVLDEQRNGDPVLYVPECTADGRYQNVQCYRSTGYCWCVNQDSGKPIPGTSVKDQDPKCEATSTSHRPMKGCPEQRKKKFLSDLMEFLNNEMLSGINGTGVGSIGGSKWPASKEEQIATWSFVVLDKNKNKILERKEWKSFRVLVSANHLLRRCGMKLPRYCDINHDRKISITEWLNCLDAHLPTAPSADPAGSANISPTSKRKGPNPLESYLKGD